MTIAGIYSSYLIVVSFLMYRRCFGEIGSFVAYPSSEPGSEANLTTTGRKERILTNTAGAALTWGPWHIPGVAGVVLNGFACAFLFTTWFFTFWPAFSPVTPENMNYNCVLWGGVIVISIVYYVVQGRKEYEGPIVEELDEDDASEAKGEMTPTGAAP